jgi:periplasmic copper chaperone A
VSAPFAARALLSTVALAATLAQAHVTIVPTEAPSGAPAELRLRVPHGCDGAATVALRVKIPDEVLAVKAQQKAGWRVQLKKRALAVPRAGTDHRAPQSEAVDEVEWRGGPLADGFYEDFGLLASLPATPGKTVYFPVVQECEKGVSRWIELPQAGVDRLEHPAPGVKVLPRP